MLFFLMPPRFSSLTILSIALALLACDQKPVDLAPETPTGQWRNVLAIPGDTPTVFSVWALSPTDVWVGTSAGVERFDGTSWSRSTDQITYAHDVWASSPSDVYVATGDRVWHHDGVGWTETPVAGQLVTGTGSSDVYATDINRVVHFTGAEWDTILAGNRFHHFISALPGPDCLVAGYDSLMRWDGNSWTSLPDPGYVEDVWRANATSWFAVGYQVIWHWDGGAWSESFTIDNTYLSAAWGSGAEDVFVSGSNGTILHYDGVDWNAVPALTRAGLIGLGGSSSSDVYATGHGGHVLRWNGASWASIHTIGPDCCLEAMWAVSSTHAFFGSSDGSVFEYQNGVWSESVVSDDCVPYCVGVYDLAGTAVENLFASLGSRVARYDGSNWSVFPDSLAGSVADMWALPSGHVFTAGNGGLVFDGATWTSTYDGEQYSQAVWAASPNCAYVVGNVVLRYDGSTWKVVHPFYGIDVWGTGCDDVYVADLDGVVHFNGARWKRVEPYRFTIFSLIGNDRDGLIAVGTDGRTFQFDGAVWRVEETGIRLRDLGVRPDGAITGLAQRRDWHGVVSWDGSR